MKNIVSVVALSATLSLAGCIASTQQEVQLGQQYAAQINQELPIVTDPEITRYINALGNQIAARADDRGLNWQFYVVNDRQVNAFAVPGGFIYVNRGLIERAATMSELAGVLGHEIAHVTERHSMERMRDAQRAEGGVGVICVVTGVCNSGLASGVINVAAGAGFARFSRDDENEADAQGIQHVVRAGIDPRGIPTMFRRLLEERQRSPGALDAFFATHPLEEDRIAATEARINQIDPAIRDGLDRDTQNFQQFKQRVSRLPAAPSANR